MTELSSFKNVLNKDWCAYFDEIKFKNKVIIKFENKEYIFDDKTEKFLYERIIK